MRLRDHYGEARGLSKMATGSVNSARDEKKVPSTRAVEIRLQGAVAILDGALAVPLIPLLTWEQREFRSVEGRIMSETKRVSECRARGGQLWIPAGLVPR